MSSSGYLSTAEVCTTTLAKNYGMELLTNSDHEESLLSRLHLDMCKNRTGLQGVDIICSSIEKSGIDALREVFTSLAVREVPVTIRIITTSLKRISELEAIKGFITNSKNVEMKIALPRSENITFHANAWRFHDNSRTGDHHYSHAIIGSSNMSLTALTESVAWNIRIIDATISKDVLDSFDSAFKKYWENSHPLLDTAAFEDISLDKSTSEINGKFFKLRGKHQKEVGILDGEVMDTAAECHVGELSGPASALKKICRAQSPDAMKDVDQDSALHQHSDTAELPEEADEDDIVKLDEDFILDKLKPRMRWRRRDCARRFRAELQSLEIAQRSTMEEVISLGVAYSAAVAALEELVNAMRNRPKSTYSLDVMYWIGLIDFISRTEWKLMRSRGMRKRHRRHRESSVKSWISLQVYYASGAFAIFQTLDVPMDAVSKATVAKAIVWTKIGRLEWATAFFNAIGSLRHILRATPFSPRSLPAEEIELVEEASMIDDLKELAMLLVFARRMIGIQYVKQSGCKSGEFIENNQEGRIEDFSDRVREQWRTWLKDHKRDATVGEWLIIIFPLAE